MGNKCSPIGFRLGITQTHRARWYAQKRRFGPWLIEDQRIRVFIKKNYGFAGIPRIDIERIGDKVKIMLQAARPGLIIGRKGAKVDKLSEDLQALLQRPVDLDIKEVEHPETNAQVVAEAIAEQLERRAQFRRTVRKYAENVMDQGAGGVKVQVKGRLGGAEIARSEALAIGKVPLHTLRAIIDYGQATAIISKGTIGVKVWIYKGEVRPDKETAHAAHAQAD